MSPTPLPPPPAPPVPAPPVPALPVPVPASEPGPAQTVFVNLPPEVIGKLTDTDQSWFTQPVATVFAAVIALCAAGLAWFSVRRQVNAEDRRSGRTARLDLMSEALTAAMTLLDTARQYTEEKASRATTKMMMVGQASPRANYEAAVTAALLARHKLEVIGGVQASAAAMEAFQNGVSDYARGGADLEATMALMDRMHAAFKNDVTERN